MGEETVALLPMIDVHDIIHHMGECGKQDELLGAVETVIAFWRHYRHTVKANWALFHPASDEAKPLGFHGDECKVTGYDKLYALQWSPVLGNSKKKTTSQDCRYPIFVCRSDRVIPDKTFRPVCRRVTWSLNALLKGVNPFVDENGIPVTGKQRELAGKPIAGCTAVMAELRGDWQWYFWLFGLRAYWKARRICGRCWATSADLSNFDEDAGWRQTRRTKADFMENVLPANPIELVEAPGYDPDMMRDCSLHTLNLGHGQTINGCALVGLAKQAAFSSSPAHIELEPQLKMAHDAFKVWCKLRKVSCSQPRFTLCTLNQHNPLKPTFLHQKGWNGRVVTAWLSDVCVAHATQNPTHENQAVAACVWGLACYFLRCEQCPRFLTQDEAAEIYRYCKISLDAFKALARMSVAGVFSS